jgi:hypothetical protein
MHKGTFFSLLALALLIASCGAKVDVKPVCGTLEAPEVGDSVANDQMLAAIDSTTISLYDVQQALCSRLGYSIEGEDITFYVDDKAVSTVTNTITDMDGFDDDAIWIGEQMRLEKSEGGGLQVRVTPGVKFITGLVLHYENMPIFTADVTQSDSGELVLTNLQ